MSLPCTESGAESTLESCINTADRRASQFNADGYVVAEQVFSETVIDKALELALGNFREVNELISAKGFEFGIGIKYGFKEIVQRHPQRYEMPYKMDDPRFDFVLSSEPIRQMVSRILQCDDYIVANRSLVISNNGCVDQAWHTDGPHMSATTDLPCHCLNVFVPLVDVTSLNGPTEFRPGSQFYTRDLAKSMLIAKLKKQLRPVDAPEVKRGSVLLVGVDTHLVSCERASATVTRSSRTVCFLYRSQTIRTICLCALHWLLCYIRLSDLLCAFSAAAQFDYRVLHRGTANRSDAMRPILVFTFAKPWYKVCSCTAPVSC
jgi:hypothetical protein